MLILSLDFACPRLGTDILNQAMDPQRFPLVREEAYHGLVQDGLYQLAESGITSTVDARSGISIWDFIFKKYVFYIVGEFCAKQKICST